MAYFLERFDTVNLPPLNPKHDLDTVQAKNTIVRTARLAFDTAGSAQAELNLPQTIRYSGFIVEDSLADLRTAVDALRALSRKRALLWRRSVDNSEVQSCYARYSASTVQRTFESPRTYETQIQFLQLTPWVGHDHTTWVLDEGDYLDMALYLDDDGYRYTLTTSPYAAVISNGGNRATNNVRLAVTAGSASITSITFACGDAEFTYSGTVTTGHILIIDSGSQSVTNYLTADYANFALTSNHIIEDWLVFEPGDNTLTITKTGGSTDSGLSIELQDGWE